MRGPSAWPHRTAQGECDETLRHPDFARHALLAFGLATAPAMAQSTPGAQVQSLKQNIKADFRSVTSNVKQDVRDLRNGNIRGAHERHKRVLRGDHARHRAAVRQSHQRRMTAAQCLARHGRFDCQRRGYRYARR